MKPKRGRGRPKGPREGRKVRVTAHYYVPPFPGARPATELLPELAAAYRQCVASDPKGIDPTGAFRDVMNQCAEAIESRDLARLAHYAYWAIKDSGIHWQSEAKEIHGEIFNQPALADIGEKKLISDKRKGHRGRW